MTNKYQVATFSLIDYNCRCDQVAMRKLEDLMQQMYYTYVDVTRCKNINNHNS